MKHDEIELEPGDVFAGYRIVQKLGPGVMGMVYLARDTKAVRRVALKILQPQLASDIEYVQAFEQQAATASLIEHRNVARFYTAGKEQDLLYTASEFIRGDTLALLIERQGRLDVQIALSLLITIGKALAYLHTRSVIHGGVNPGNIRFTPTGEVKLVDAGLAKKLVLRQAPSDVKASVTPVYLAPELIGKPARIDARADIYSLGITAYEALTGSKPFVSDSPHETVLRIMNEPLRAEDIKGVHPAIASLIAKMVAKDPGDRPISMPVVIAELERIAAKLAPVIVGAGPSDATRKAMKERASRARRKIYLYILIGVIVAGTFLVFHLPETGTVQPPAPKTQTNEQEAQTALEAVTTFEANHPDDTSGTIERYHSITRAFPDTAAAGKAREAQYRLALKLASDTANGLTVEEKLYEAARIYAAFEKQYAGSTQARDAGRRKTHLLNQIEDRFNNDMLEAARLGQREEIQQAVALLEKVEIYGSPAHWRKARVKIDEMLRSTGDMALKGKHGAAWQTVEPLLAVIANQIAKRRYEPAQNSCDIFLSCPLAERAADIVRWEKEDISRLLKVRENFNAALGDAVKRGDQTSFTLIDETAVKGVVRRERDDYYLHFPDGRKWRIQPGNLTSSNVLKLAGMETDEPDAILTTVLYELHHGNVENARILFARLSSRLDKEMLARYQNKLVTIPPLLAGSIARVRSSMSPQDIRQTLKIMESARRLIKQKSWDEAYPLLRQAVELNPVEWKNWHLLASTSSARGLDAEAAIYYRRAIVLSPGNPVLWNEFGKLHLTRNELGLALAAFRQAARISPANPVAMHGRVEILLRLNRPEEARRVQEEWGKNRRR